MMRLNDKTMLFLATALCLTVFSAGALFATMTAHTTPKPPCRMAGRGEVVVSADNCDAVAQRAFMRLLFAQPR
jgi:hypothetical protein